jgi:hypothetical protein
MLYRLTPYATAAARQPLFELESRRVKWAGDISTFLNKSRTRLFWIVSVVMLLWLLGLFIHSYSGQYSLYTERTLTAGSWLALIGLLASAQVDFVSIAAALTGINGEIVSGRWDLLRLAGMREGYFTVSKHGVAQLKAWRTVLNVVGIRAAGSLILTIGLVMQLSMLLGDVDAIITLIVIPIFIAISAFFVLEPLWRMKTMTALGLLVSSYTRNPMSSPLAAFGVTMCVWVAQFVIFGAVMIGMGALFFPLLFFGSSLICVPFVAILLALTAIYGFYEIVQRWSLRRIALRLARLES